LTALSSQVFNGEFGYFFRYLTIGFVCSFFSVPTLVLASPFSFLLSPF